MTTFEYIAKDQAGETVRGKYEAKSNDQAVSYLVSRNYTPVSVKEVKEISLGKQFNFSLERVKPGEIYDFTRQLSIMLKAGVPLVDSLTAITEQTESKKLKEVITNVVNDVSAGQSLSTALEKHPKVFSGMFVNMVKAGESAGVVDTILVRLAAFINHDLIVRNDVKKALRYPIIVLTGVLGAAVGAISFVLPKFTALFARSDSELPLPTRVLLGADQFLRNYWFLILLVIVAVVVAIKFYAKTEKGKYNIHRFYLGMPIFGTLYHKLALARFCHILETLDRSGVPILEALRISSRTLDNEVFNKAVDEAAKKVAQGRLVAPSLRSSSSLFPRQMLKMIEVGEAAGSMDEMLLEIATLYDTEADDLLGKLTTMIEPLLTIVMGAMILTLALAMFLPMWSMYETF